MRRDELRRAIELPARRVGLRVELDVADTLIADVDGEPGGLPLLSAALVELWQHRDGRALRLVDYERAGGVHGAVARLAERAYERLDADQQHVARRILMRLAGDGEGDAVVRRRVPLAESARPPTSATTSPRFSPSWPTTGWSPSGTAMSRSHTRRCCANGHACAAGSRRTRRAAACTAT